MIDGYQSPELGDYSQEEIKIRQEESDSAFYETANQMEKWAFSSPIEGLKRIFGYKK